VEPYSGGNRRRGGLVVVGGALIGSKSDGLGAIPAQGPTIRGKDRIYFPGKATSRRRGVWEPNNRENWAGWKKKKKKSS